MKHRILIALAACALAAPLQAQSPQRIESFLYVPRTDSATHRDVSWSVLHATPGRGRAEGGTITWGCRENGVMLAVAAPELGAGQAVRMVYRFDDGPADTVAVTTWSQASALSLPADRQVAFTQRALEAEQLSVQLIHPRGQSERRFALRGATLALPLLPCVVQLAGIRDVAPEFAQMMRPGNHPPGAANAAPRLTNPDEVQRAMRSNWPDAVAGGQVVVRLRVMEDGTVDPASIQVPGYTSTELVYAARRIAAVMRFSPALVNGRPVAAETSVPLQFQAAN